MLQACFSIIPKDGVMCKRGARLCVNEMRDAFPGCSLVIAYQPCHGFRPAMDELSVKAIDRRPIATRDRKWTQSAMTWLVSQNVSPNAISIAGMCACIAAGLALGPTSVEYNRVFWLIAALGAQLRLTANMLDGMVALASGRDSKVGELYNEVPDRVSDAAMFDWNYRPTLLLIVFAVEPNDISETFPEPVRINLIIGAPLNFAGTPNNREGWSQIARSLESSLRKLAAQ
jgi:hypothetical protein